MPRKKTRQQMSMRIDNAVMELVNRTIEQKKEVNLTGLVERGLLLAINELETQDPIYQQARAILNREGVVFSRRALKVAALQDFPKVRELNPLEQAWRYFMLAGIDSVSAWPDYKRALEAGKATKDSWDSLPRIDGVDSIDEPE